MVNYQNKCRLIRGWDDLFNKLKENINQVIFLLILQNFVALYKVKSNHVLINFLFCHQVAAMKLSPYFRVFEEEANTWEDKLNRIMVVLMIWKII